MEKTLQGREKKVWQQLEQWEQLCFLGKEEKVYSSLEKQLNTAIENWQPETQQRVLTTIDTVIFHTHAIIQNSKYEQETVEKVLELGRIFNSNIETVSDMNQLSIDQLRYIANKFLAKQRLVALGQGGAIGVVGPLLLAIDLPLMLTINLRSIQLVAMTYGYDVTIPYERMLALKVFHVATLPKSLQKEGWEQLLLTLDTYEDEWLLFDDSYQKSVWLQQPIKQLAKALTIHFLRKKLVNGLPVFGIALGASTNYFLAKQVSEIAHNFYQKRFLIDKNK